MCSSDLAVDSNDRVVVHLVTTKFGTAKRTAVRVGVDDRLNKWQRPHTVGNVQWAAGWGGLAGNGRPGNELG